MINLIFSFLTITLSLVVVFLLLKSYINRLKNSSSETDEDVKKILDEALNPKNWYDNITFEQLPKYVRIVKNHAQYNQWGTGNKIRRVDKWETTGKPGLFMADIGASFLITMEDLEPCTEEQYDAAEFDEEKAWIK